MLVARPVKLHDFALEKDSVLAQVLAGLEKPVKELPSKLLYDAHGSELFDEITRLKEYYPTRTEVAIMKRHIGAMADHIGPHAMIVEYGSGTSEKSQILLDNLPTIAAYVPIDISKVQLVASAKELAKRYPTLEILPVCADYNDDFEIPESHQPVERRVVYYPGSTIGNFHFDEAIRFLARIAEIDGPGGGLLIGVDLQKNPAILHRAYNDGEGVTAAFNLNLLTRLNREVGTDFDLAKFKHRAIYNQNVGRIEMHLVSLRNQVVTVGGTPISFDEGETIWTECSYKYTLKSFENLVDQAGFDVESVWTDDDDLFSVHYLSARAQTPS